MHSFVKGNLVRRVSTDFGSMKVGDILEVMEVSAYGLYFDNDINHYDSSNFELVKEDEIMAEIQKKHVHANEIKAWADGAEIECRISSIGDWSAIDMPTWNTEWKYRVKTIVKPDKIVKGLITQSGHYDQYPTLGNIKLTFDGETGRLKSAEVIKG